MAKTSKQEHLKCDACAFALAGSTGKQLYHGDQCPWCNRGTLRSTAAVTLTRAVGNPVKYPAKTAEF